MSRIQEEITSYSWELLLRFLGLTGDVLSNAEKAAEFTFNKAEDATKGVLSLMIKAARKRAQNKEYNAEDTLKVLTEMERRSKENNEILRNVSVADEDYAELSQKLKEKKVLFTTLDMNGDDAKMILYLSGEDYSVQKAVNSFMIDRGLLTEIDAEQFIDMHLKGGVGTVDGLSDIELEVFRKYAKAEAFPFAKVTTNKDHNLIIYEPEKSNEIKKALSATVFALSDERGEKLKKALEAQIYSRNLLYAAIEDGKEHVIISSKNKDHFIIIDEDSATLYKNNKKVFEVPRRTKEFFAKTLQMSDGVENATVLNKDEYTIKGSADELKVAFHEETLKQKNKNRVSQQNLDEFFDEINERRRLVEEKMSLDNESQSPFWVFDNSYSYSTAATHEGIDDRDDEKRREMELITKVSSRLKAMSVDETTITSSRSIDAIIARAEQRKNDNIKNKADHSKSDRDNLAHIFTNRNK